YAPQMACDACGWVAGCGSCSAHMVWHKRENALRCHHCGAGSRVPTQCPDCGNQDLVGFGRGTQKIEETLEGLLPDAQILRIDADSTRNKGQIEHLLEQIHSGHAHVLVGTQMIAKGHDFANIGLVVALNVDASLFSQSYKAPERLFAQLMQVAGRAGRRHGAARMLVQTRYPHHPLFEALVKHDYRQFASFELTTRRDARMPPFAFQALLRADHKSLSRCLEFLKTAKDLAQPLLGEWVFVCDPVPLSVVRVADTERAQMLIESDQRAALHGFLDQWLNRLAEQKTPVRWFLEVDPSEL
ncbi:MAG: primosomal protein N', partial [Limnobacter sp.]|nr:primosomal protein N' [Limnobacter sp.]